MGRLPLPVFLLVDELVSDEVEVSDVLEDAFSAVVEDGLVSLLVALFASFAIVHCLLWTWIWAFYYSRQSFKKRGYFNNWNLVSCSTSSIHPRANLALFLRLVRAGRLELPLPEETRFCVPATAFAAAPDQGRSWSGLSHHLAPLPEFRWVPSSLYTFLKIKAWLGVAMLK